MPILDDYITDTLMRDLVGHDRKPVSFLVYLCVAESVGISKSSAQAAIGWLLKRKLLAVRKENVTATPLYTVRSPWREAVRRLKNHG
jgi:hypothetical protein